MQQEGEDAKKWPTAIIDAIHLIKFGMTHATVVWLSWKQKK